MKPQGPSNTDCKHCYRFLDIEICPTINHLLKESYKVACLCEYIDVKLYKYINNMNIFIYTRKRDTK